MSSLFAPHLTAQQAASTTTPSTTTLTGRVHTSDGRVLAGVVVMILETLEETHTGTDGRFLLTSTHRGAATVVARAVGFVPATADVTMPSDSVLAFRLAPSPPTLTQFVVVAAGEYTIGTGQTASLKPLEVAQTPGAAANIARAIQTLPGAQNVDEGTGLFVRGGDVTETRVLVDDAWLLSPVRFDNPTGHTTATINPFLLERTVFSSGGFGVPYGNALSGLVRMESAATPSHRTASLSASIGGASAAFGARLHPRVGVRASAGLNSLAALTATFGQAQPYEPPPRSGDLSGSL
ncbi:MAG TPA: carboxypeptidase regulatory-like domain-containing protein, partial [Gemmatimonas sp.]|uniref:carboxypeptidase regulatory-like domain-containing protein n=1 Tax=Gemmatimonas sp. TaxID=1962908 RepID=UPI002EDA3E74